MIRCVVFLTRRMSLRKWDQGGMLHRELALYRRLAADGIEVTLVSYGDSSEQAYAELAHPVKIASNRWHLPRSWYASWIGRLHQELLESCDLIKTNQMDGAEVALAAARQFRKPLIARCGYMWSEFARQLVGPDARETRRAERIEREVVSGAQEIVVTTPAMAQSFRRRFPWRANAVRVVPNYVDTDLFCPRPEKRPSVDIIYVGRVAVQKNLSALFQAQRGTEWQTLVVGDGPLRESLRAEYFDLAAQITWLGKVPHPQLPKLLGEAKVFVLPSLFEGHPKVLLEAMANGSAVVAARSPGIEQLVTHGQTGWLYDGSPDGLRRALNQVLRDEPLRKQLGQQARRTAVERFGLDGLADVERQVYQEVVSRRVAVRHRREASRAA